MQTDTRACEQRRSRDRRVIYAAGLGIPTHEATQREIRRRRGSRAAEVEGTLPSRRRAQAAPGASSSHRLLFDIGQLAASAGEAARSGFSQAYGSSSALFPPDLSRR
ncbi:hypothetical protein MTO96_015831 [Rhipicephalus appendiculatus]